MRVKEIAEILPLAELFGNPGEEIAAVCYDSRQAAPGALFVAMKGLKTDGHSYIPQALQAGCRAFICDNPDAVRFASQASIILVPSSRKAMAVASAAVYGYPSRSMRVYAVTGTNGKTSTTHMIESIQKAAGYTTGIIGTLGAKIAGEWIALSHTTPESSDLQELLARMLRAGVSAVAMEASSIAIDQSRVDGCELDVALFTNLTQDHLDYHGSMQQYFDAKLELFTRFQQETSKPFASVINIDDPWGREYLLPKALGRRVTFGTGADADYHAANIRTAPGGSCFGLECPEGSVKIRLSLGGLFNVHNALGAAAACLASGIELEAVQKGLESIKSVPGRFELVDSGQPFAAIVDYAHTPDGLENVLESCRKLTQGRVIAVFGCGGDRDRAKRPLMGGIAVRLADECILTSDNPRTEDPADIAEDVLAQMTSEERSKVYVELDRRAAIFEACRRARQGDIVVIAGKGHETYQIFRDRTIDFDDRLVLREAIESLGHVGGDRH